MRPHRRPPRVGIDARLLAYSRAGISQYVTCLLRAMQALHPPETVVPLYHRKQRDGLEGWKVGRLQACNLPTFQPSNLPTRLWTPPHHPWEAWVLPLELARLGIDLLHSPDHVLPRGLRCHAVITVHDLSFLRYPHTHSPASLRYYGQIFRSVQAADRIIAVSEATKRELLSLVGADPRRVRVISEAAALQLSDAAAPERPFATDKELLVSDGGAPRRLPWPYFLVVGTIEPRKNVPRILGALAALGAEHGRVGLVLAGSPGWGEAEVRRQVKDLGLSDRVCFWGPPSAAELRRLYAGAAALVYPSIYEGFGVPILEAFACGTPVITSSVSSMPEVAGDAALLVDPFRTDEIAAAMRRVLTDATLCRELRARGAARVRLFSWERAAAATLGVYREVLAP